MHSTFPSNDALDFELHQSVIQEQAIAGSDHVRQTRKAYRGDARVADHVGRGQDEPIVGPQLDRLGLDPAEADLGTGQICRYGDAALGCGRGIADGRDHLRMAV
jgi:hypothetical protein